jgi:ectoine hydroxylase-related dioxygenase (phytanoyl-CoA dioxygenase family)
MASTEQLRASIAAEGFALVRSRVEPPLLRSLQVEMEGKRYADRGLLRLPSIISLARSANLRQLVEPVLGCQCFAVRALLFDKTPEANWKVTWHQDRTIAVRERKEVPGFGPWTDKDGIPHVQPPAEILDTMLAVRVHLDDCSEANGALKVLPGSHTFGKVPDAHLNVIDRNGQLLCIAHPGDVLLMRPLLMHASSASLEPQHRRVIHLEYSATELPGGLEWADRI